MNSTHEYIIISCTPANEDMSWCHVKFIFAFIFQACSKGRGAEKSLSQSSVRHQSAARYEQQKKQVSLQGHIDLKMPT